MKRKTDKNILIAFLLNLAFSAIELVGGIITGSVAIISDSIHDLGDALSIGTAFFLEKKSKKAPDEKYTYGYMRYSVLGSVITTVILLFGSLTVIYNAVNRIITPKEINYDGMIIFAVIGASVNFAAAYFTREGDSLNQKAVNLHMLEDVLGWVVVLSGAIIMRFTDISVIDPLMSIGVALFILINAAKNLKEVLDIFLEKSPDNIDLSELREHLLSIDGVIDVHHIHLRTIDGYNNYITLHVVAKGEHHEIKHKVREELIEHGISHATIELEDENEHCHERECHIRPSEAGHHHHHHHH
ncbi:MAG: cation transporter [Clostridia bacterium]|nr:cation transporter [Clostridia bacterium]